MMRFLMIWFLSLAGIFAQSPVPAPSPQEDQELAWAQQFAINVLDTLYSGQSALVVDMMNPDPPRWKGSKEHLRKIREEDLKNMAAARSAYGLRLALACTQASRIAMANRPSDEKFFSFAFKSNYGDQLTAVDLLTILKKGDRFYVERFR